MMEYFKHNRAVSDQKDKVGALNDGKTRRSSVAVLMSTYNGERFLLEQIESIVAQEDVDVTLFVRDDGSSDRTIELLNSIAAGSNRISFEFGDNLGVVASFLTLLQNAGPDFDFYAFSDQDDYWLPDKLHRAEKMIVQKRRKSRDQVPYMYYSRLDFVDEFLNPLGHSIIPTTSGFHNALVQNQATGCTVVLDQTARNLVCNNPPNWALMHDWWCYLTVSAFGEVIYDAESRIRYRKHGHNVTPATPNFVRELYARTRRFLGENDIPEKVTDQAREFDRRFGDALSNDKRAILKGFLEARGKGLPGRLRYSLTMPVRRNTPIDNFILRILIVIGRF